MIRRSAALLGVAVTLLLVLTACGGSEEPTGGASVRDVLTQAKKQFDDAKSVHLVLETASKPEPGNDAVLGAEGDLTQQPAFEGTVTVVLGGFNADVPVVAIGDEVVAKLPLTPAYVPIDPAEYSAPNPADFADPEAGISALLLELEGAEEAGQKRLGETVLTTYEGTLSGELVDPIIPSASQDGTYETAVGIDEDGRIITLSVTGDFFEHDGPVTYDLTFSDYDEDVEISAP